MMEILSTYKINIVLVISFLLLLFLFLFPIETKISKLIRAEVTKRVLFAILSLVILSLLFLFSPLKFSLTLPTTLFSLFVFLFGILSNRSHIYTLALASLIMTPVMLVLKLDNVAEFFARSCYLLLVLGVLKDLFYEKIFE